ncbi:MAG: protein kinase domain-containing protein [Rickettsiales bacterium]
MVPMIEEQVETGLGALLQSYQSSYIPGGDKKDDLNGRFSLQPSKPLMQFDHAYGKAYEASDDFNHTRHTYAIVCDNKLPYRHQAITELTGYVNPHLVPLLGTGTVNCSHLGEARQVMFFELPTGTRLSDAIKNNGRMHEHKVIDNVMNPLAKALLGMGERKISHGNICPASVFIGDTTLLGECASMPCGTLASYLYEPIERLMCDPLGHGEANDKTDMYALGILAYELMYGLDKIRAIPREELIRRVLQQGAYSVFANNREFSDAFQDFFRGVLNDNPAERWGLEQLAQWASGKRFNMIAPQAPKDATRPFTFGGEEYFSRRLLANAYHRNWREASKEIRGSRIDRWFETGLHRIELAERMERALRIAGADASDRQVSDMMTRAICILDPNGPLRSMSLSLRPDAIGIVLADLMRSEAPELQQVINFIETDVGVYWSEQSDANKSQDMSAAIWRLQKVRSQLKNHSFGFGLERVLYELNPSLPCQSPLMKDYHVTNAIDALKTLDALAHSFAPETSFADRHLASFVAAKIDRSKPIKLHDLSAIPSLMANHELVVMRLLAEAQHKQKKLQLVGLCAWAAMRIEKMIDEIHNRVIRKRLKLQLKKLAGTGNISEVMSVIVNRDIVERDLSGFTQAIALHEINFKRIEMMNKQEILAFKANRMGGRMAVGISYTAFMITFFVTLTNLLRL